MQLLKRNTQAVLTLDLDLDYVKAIILQDMKFTALEQPQALCAGWP